MKRKRIIDTIVFLFIFLFVYTAVSKLNERDRFKAVLEQSPLIGPKASFFSLALPILELVVAFLLVFPLIRIWGLYASFVLMVIFTLYIGYMLLYTPHLPCSCGGVLKQMSWTQHLFFNAGFTLLALTGIWLTKINTNHTRSPFIRT